MIIDQSQTLLLTVDVIYIIGEPVVNILFNSYILPRPEKPYDNEVLRELLPAEHKSLLRSMNRSSILLNYCALSLDPHVFNLIREAPQRVGIYCAADQAVPQPNRVLDYMQAPSLHSYSQAVPPKWILQSSVGLAAATLSILFNIQGGVHTFLHPLSACQNAVTQAGLDLEMNLIDFALVCAASSADDPLVRYKYANLFNRSLSEGAATIVLSRGERQLSLPILRETSDKDFYGIAHPMIEFLKNQGVKDG